MATFMTVLTVAKRAVATLAVTYPIALMLAFVNLWGQATACLGHTPLYMENDPKFICRNDVGYQAAAGYVGFLLALMLPVVPILGWVLFTTFRVHPWRSATYLGVHLLGWFGLSLLARANPYVVDWFLD